MVGTRHERSAVCGVPLGRVRAGWQARRLMLLDSTTTVEKNWLECSPIRSSIFGPTNRKNC